MKGRILRRRTRARASGAGYTLIELMVVVVLIAMLAMLAAPSMLTARGDRYAFNVARSVAELVHGARTRAAGRGAAHLVIYQQVTDGDRGRLLVFEALDGTDGTATPRGPNPAPGCRRTNQWAFAASWTAGSTDATNNAQFVDAYNINPASTADIIAKENIRMISSVTPPSGTAGPADSWAMCITPNGTTYFGSGATPGDAITTMQASYTPFTSMVEVDVARHEPADNTKVRGLNRRVIMAGAGAPRIKSE